MNPPVQIRELQPGDWSEVQRIYQEGIDGGHATFESIAPDWEAFNTSRLPGHRHVAVAPDGGVLGWAAVTQVSARPAYVGVVEHSVYVSSHARGLGVGSALLQAVISSTENAGIWTIQSSIFPENLASLALHQKAGFTTIGRRQRIARMPQGPLAGQWRDTLLIERRSHLL